MAERVVLTCDHKASGRVCGKDAHTYTLHGPGGAWVIDLCDKHAEPVSGLFTRDGRVAGKETGRRTLADASRPFYENR